LAAPAAPRTVLRVSADVLCVAASVRSAAIARALAPERQVIGVAPPALARRTAAASAALDRTFDRLDWASVHSIVVWPRLAARTPSASPSLRVWRQRSDAALRNTYLAARAGGLRLQQRGRGEVLLVIDGVSAADSVGMVVAEGLRVLGDALRKLFRPSLRIGVLCVDGLGARPSAPDTVRAIAHWLDHPAARHGRRGARAAAAGAGLTSK